MTTHKIGEGERLERGKRYLFFSDGEGWVTATWYGSLGAREIIVAENPQIMIELKYHDVTHWAEIPGTPEKI
jgi:hypothetical protein